MNQRAEAHPRNAFRLVLPAVGHGQEISKMSLVVLTRFNSYGLRLWDIFPLGSKLLQDEAHLIGLDFRHCGVHRYTLPIGRPRIKMQIHARRHQKGVYGLTENPR